MEGSLYWGDPPVLFGWIINMALYDGRGQERGEEQVESRLQEMGAGSESRGRSRVRVAGGTRPGAEFAGQARWSEDQAPAFCISAPHLAWLPSRSQFYFA